MNKLILVLCSALLSLPALAGTDRCGFLINPNPGVTVDQLSDARLQEIAGEVKSFYDRKVTEADAAYQKAIADLNIDPSCDHSGEILNNQMQAALDAREAAYQGAGAHAVARGNELCAGLCTTAADGCRQAGGQAPGQAPGQLPAPAGS